MIKYQLMNMNNKGKKMNRLTKKQEEKIANYLKSLEGNTIPD
tara:strand:- start:954 stop:1079 length:126 start_codon:yes stop_codon:yes gene_type:complete